MFLVVQFHCAGGTMEVVPQLWFNRLNSQCWWPDNVQDPQEIYKLVTSSAVVGKSWSLYDAGSLGTFKTYVSANSNLKEAMSGNIIHSSTDNEFRGRGQRKKKKSSRYDDDYDDAVCRDEVCPPKKKSARKNVSLPSDDEEIVNNNNSVKGSSSKSSRAKPGITRTLPAVPSDLGESNLLVVGDPSRKTHSQSALNVLHTEGTQLPKEDLNNGISFESLSNSEESEIENNQSALEKVTPVLKANSTKTATPASTMFSSSTATPAINPTSSSTGDISSTATSILAGLKDNGVIKSLVQRLDAILRNQEFMKVTQREQTSLLDLLLKKTSTMEPELQDIEKQFGFPLETLESVNNLENDLSNEVVRAKLISFLGGIGGTSNTIIGRILSRVLTNELAAKFCYKGQNHEKQGFRSLRLCSAVIEAVRSQSRFQDLKENYIETKMKNWLRHAPSRKDQSKNQQEQGQSGN